MSAHSLSPKARGALILFEGIDRCGKTTQVGLLEEHLKSSLGADCADKIRFPDRTSYIGKLINDYLANTASTQGVSDQTIHLLFSANRWEASKQLEERLLAGTTLVCDRYAYSGVSFSAAKQTPGMDLDWCKACDRGLPAPDCVIYLDMPVEAAASRGGFGEERYEVPELQRRVREQFMLLKAEDEARGRPWHALNADRPIEVIRDEIRLIADRTVAEVKDQPIRRLWSPTQA